MRFRCYDISPEPVFPPDFLINGLTISSFLDFLSCFAALPLFWSLATLVSCEFRLIGPVRSVMPLGRTVYAGEYGNRGPKSTRNFQAAEG
jgi:hypothetical protein